MTKEEMIKWAEDQIESATEYLKIFGSDETSDHIKETLDFYRSALPLLKRGDAQAIVRKAGNRGQS